MDEQVEKPWYSKERVEFLIEFSQRLNTVLSYPTNMFDLKIPKHLYSEEWREWNKKRNAARKEEWFVQYPDAIDKECRPIFMGAGIKTMCDTALMHLLLDDALSDLSYRQQNGGQGTEFNDEFEEDAKSRLTRAARQFVLALDCKDILATDHELEKRNAG